MPRTATIPTKVEVEVRAKRRPPDETVLAALAAVWAVAARVEMLAEGPTLMVFFWSILSITSAAAYIACGIAAWRFAKRSASKALIEVDYDLKDGE